MESLYTVVLFLETLDRALVPCYIYTITTITVYCTKLEYVQDLLSFQLMQIILGRF